MRKTFFTLGAIVANSEKYLPEWLTFHWLTGVERFTLVLEGDCSAIERQIRRLPFQRRVWIYRFREVWDRVKIHTGSWANSVETDCGSVREDGETIETGTTWGTTKEPIWNAIRINRYQPRSRQDWIESCEPRCYADKKELTDIFCRLDRNEIFDPLILRYAARMKSVLS